VIFNIIENLKDKCINGCRILYTQQNNASMDLQMHIVFSNQVPACNYGCNYPKPLSFHGLVSDIQPIGSYYHFSSFQANALIESYFTMFNNSGHEPPMLALPLYIDNVSNRGLSCCRFTT
jgi:hypothetical protein